MRLPRETSGTELARLLGKYGYQITRQSGSHIRLTTTSKGEHHITIPAHKNLRVGTLSNILHEVAIHFGMDKAALVKDLF
ncbi:MAG TPA: type II toxin-antitoxin system HicA family toxin [Sedimentisphaerales bacterium]|nr:type II toxin-antitoxin system HicA family toxin [Sedimentisphaerales bacterium]